MAYKYSFTELLLFPPLGLNEYRLKERLLGKTVLITGASFGIGESLAYKLAAAGTHLLLVARTEEKLHEVKTRIENAGGKATVFVTDISKPDEVKDLIDSLNRIPGGVDILVNNAGKSIRRSIMESLDRPHDFSRTMAINYSGPVQLLLALIPVLVKNKGQIINVSTVSVLLAPTPKWAAYQASKSAFDQWFRCVSPELNAREVATTSIYLPLVRTRMIAPTSEYNNMPAMDPDHVAKVICKSVISRKRKYVPWWLFSGQLGSLLFRGIWESLNTRLLRRKSDYAQRS